MNVTDPADAGDRPTPQTGVRLLVSLDPAITAAEDWLRLALAAAARSGAEVVAVSVTESRYRELAGLGFVREYGRGYGSPRPLDPGRLERAQRASARRLRERFETLARSHSVRWRIEERTGSNPGEVLWRCGEYSQLLLAGSGMTGAGPGAGTGARTAAGSVAATGSRRPRRRRRIVVVGRTPAEVERLADHARAYAQEDQGIEAGLVGPDPGTGGTIAGLRWTPIPDPTPSALAAFVRRRDGGLLVAPRALPCNAAALWEVADFPIILVG